MDPCRQVSWNKTVWMAKEMHHNWHMLFLIPGDGKLTQGIAEHTDGQAFQAQFHLGMGI